MRRAQQLFEVRDRSRTTSARSSAGQSRVFTTRLPCSAATRQKHGAHSRKHSRAQVPTRRLANLPNGRRLRLARIARGAGRPNRRPRTVSETAHPAAEWATEVLAVRQATSAALVQGYLQETIPRLDHRVRAIDRELSQPVDPRFAEHSLARAFERASRRATSLICARPVPSRNAPSRPRSSNTCAMSCGRDENGTGVSGGRLPPLPSTPCASAGSPVAMSCAACTRSLTEQLCNELSPSLRRRAPNARPCPLCGKLRASRGYSVDHPGRLIRAGFLPLADRLRACSTQGFDSDETPVTRSYFKTALMSSGRKTTTITAMTTGMIGSRNKYAARAPTPAVRRAAKD